MLNAFTQVPALNFAATKLEMLTDLSTNRLEPPITSELFDDEVKAFLDKPYTSALPCSTTEVERAVQVLELSLEPSYLIIIHISDCHTICLCVC